MSLYYNKYLKYKKKYIELKNQMGGDIKITNNNNKKNIIFFKHLNKFLNLNYVTLDSNIFINSEIDIKGLGKNNTLVISKLIEFLYKDYQIIYKKLENNNFTQKIVNGENEYIDNRLNIISKDNYIISPSKIRYFLKDVLKENIYDRNHKHIGVITIKLFDNQNKCYKITSVNELILNDSLSEIVELKPFSFKECD